MNTNITKEQLEEMITDTSLKICGDIVQQVSSVFDDLSEEQKNNPIAREVLVATIAQSNAICVFKEVLTKLLFE